MNKYENKQTISFYSVIKALSAAFDLVSDEVSGHHRKTTFLALLIAEEMGISKREIKDLVYASLIHDLGVFYLNQRIADLSFDNNSNLHQEVGYLLLKDYIHRKEIAEIIRYHHVDWKDRLGKSSAGINIPRTSHILHLADRIAVLLENNHNILNQINIIDNIISKLACKKFWPEAVAAFQKLKNQEFIWLTVISPERIVDYLDKLDFIKEEKITLDEFLLIGKSLSHIIDFRSSFTATHSTGIACLAEQMATRYNFDKNDVLKLKIAGFFHDIGKLAIPLRILNKPAQLKNKEYNIIKIHPYYTYQILAQIKEFPMISEWAAFHHEQNNGEGYPFHLAGKDLSQGSKIMSVVDKFTALTEERPYRASLQADKVKYILSNMAEKNEIDEMITTDMLDNYNFYNNIRINKQKESRSYYQEFKKTIASKRDQFII